jgi:tetratricopeptide (TPR) repeat protein
LGAFDFVAMRIRFFLACCVLCVSATSLRADDASAASRAAYNSAIEILRRGDDERFEAAVSNFRAQIKNEALVGELRLEAALFRAGVAWKSGRPADLEAATQGLRDFVRDNLRHARVAEARLALAELAAFGSEQDLDTARNQLRLARSANPSPAVVERCDVFAIYLAGRPGSADNPVALADRFLQRYAQSPYADSVRFVRAEELLERGEFEESGTGFERLAEDRPDSSLVPGALFGAGHAALRQQSGPALERSSTLFESAAGVAQDDRLRVAAQLGGARARLRLGRPSVALLQSDALLAGAERSSESPNVAALLTRGEALLRLSIDDPTLLSEAAKAFRAVTVAKSVSPERRRQAFAQLGDVLRRSGDLTAAIAAWREALRTPPAKGQDAIWFARAGFDAAQALQEFKLWREAAAVYQQIGEAGGLLRTESEARLAQLRLAHFLWPQGTPP